MGVITTIDRQINNYLEQLNTKQKKAVLTVVKTFVEGEMRHDYWDDESFVAEIDRRRAEYELGKKKIFTLDELEAGARKSFKAKKKTRK